MATGVSLATKGQISKTSTGEIVIQPISGSILIEPQVWQQISIPVRYGYFDKTSGSIVSDGTTVSNIKNYVMDQIEYITGKSAAEIIEVANTFRGNDNFFRSYIPGVTNPSSGNNFELAYDDNGNIEYAGFWIKSKYDQGITITWRT